jgi:hypothetical protein
VRTGVTSRAAPHTPTVLPPPPPSVPPNNPTLGRRVNLSPSEGAYGRHVKGSASPHDLEAAFQLLHLLFARPPQLQAGEMDSVMVQVCRNVWVDV